MTITFQVDQYLPAAIEKSIYEPIVLPKGQMGNGIAACRAEMTVDGQTKEVWVSRSESLDPPPPQTVRFRDSVYQVMYDVDRKPLGFELKLDDFDTGFEPGTEQATHFESKVRLTDKSAGIKDQPHTIWMNHPLDHRGYTFYQSNYIRVRDPHTRQYHGAVSVGLPGGHQPRPADHLRRLLAGGAGRIPAVLHAGGNLHRRRQARARARRGQGRKPGRRRNQAELGMKHTGRNSDYVNADSTPTRRRALGDSNMRRIGKLLGGLVLAGMWAAVLPARGADDSQVAGGRPGLRADRQGGRDARRAGQAAGHRRPRRGQAGLRPRDDQAARPERRDRKDPRPGEPRPQSRRRIDRSKSGGPSGPSSAGRSTPSSGTTSRSSWPNISPCDGGSWRKRSRPGSRRSPTSRRPPTTKRPLCKSWRPTRSRPPTELTAFLRGSKLPLEDKKTIAELAAKLSEEHKWLTPARARRGQDHRQGSRRTPSSTGPASSRSRSGSSTPIPSRPPGSPRSSGGRSRSPCGSRPTRRTAESGSRIPD